jgi:hypothetical protein
MTSFDDVVHDWRICAKLGWKEFHWIPVMEQPRGKGRDLVDVTIILTRITVGLITTITVREEIYCDKRRFRWLGNRRGGDMRETVSKIRENRFIPVEADAASDPGWGFVSERAVVGKRERTAYEPLSEPRSKGGRFRHSR